MDFRRSKKTWHGNFSKRELPAKSLRNGGMHSHHFFTFLGHWQQREENASKAASQLTNLRIPLKLMLLKTSSCQLELSDNARENRNQKLA